MLEATDTVNAPWHLIADDDPRSARLEVFGTIADAIEKAVQMPVESASDKRTAATYDVLSKIDANKELTKEEYKEKLDKYQKKLTQLQIEMFKAQIPVVIGFEGWDAAGKGGAIRRLTAALDRWASMCIRLRRRTWLKSSSIISGASGPDCHSRAL